MSFNFKTCCRGSSTWIHLGRCFGFEVLSVGRGDEDAISSACSSSCAERLVQSFIEPTNFVPVKTSDE